MKYESGRNEEDFETYIKSHATKSSKALAFEKEEL